MLQHPFFQVGQEGQGVLREEEGLLPLRELGGLLQGLGLAHAGGDVGIRGVGAVEEVGLVHVPEGRLRLLGLGETRKVIVDVGHVRQDIRPAVRVREAEQQGKALEAVGQDGQEGPGVGDDSFDVRAAGEGVVLDQVEEGPGGLHEVLKGRDGDLLVDVRHHHRGLRGVQDGESAPDVELREQGARERSPR